MVAGLVSTGPYFFKLKIMEKIQLLDIYLKESQEKRLSEVAKDLNLSRTEAGDLCVAAATSTEELENQLRNLPHIKIPS